MSSKKSIKSQEKKLDGNETPPETDSHDLLLSPMASRYLELLPSETNIVAAAAMAPQANTFEPYKLLIDVEKLREAENIRVLERRRSLAHEMEIEELETLLRHLGCSEPHLGIPLKDPIWRDPIVSPALHVYEELRRANDNPVEKDKANDVSLFLEMHEHKSGFKRPAPKCFISDALRYCSGIADHPIAALKEAFKDLLTHSRWELKNSKHKNLNQLKHPLRRDNPNCPLPTSSFSKNQIEKIEEDALIVQGERELAALLKHFGGFWEIAQNHYLVAHEAQSDANSRRIEALEKSEKTGVNNRERGRWLKCARTFARQHGKIISTGEGNSSNVIPIIEELITKYCSYEGAPADDLVKALFQAILVAKDDLDVTPEIIKQRAIESLGVRKSVPFKALTDKTIQEIAEVILVKTKIKRSTCTP